MHVLEVLDSDGSKASDMSDFTRMSRVYAFCSYMPHLLKSAYFTYRGNAGPQGTLPIFRAQALTGWELPDGRMVKDLDEDSAALSILEGVPATVVLRRLREGWRPELDTMDALTRMASLARSSKTFELTVVVKFPDLASASAALELLRAQGYAASLQRKRIKVRIQQSTGARAEWNRLVEKKEMISRVCLPLGGTYEDEELQLDG